MLKRQFWLMPVFIVVAGLGLGSAGLLKPYLAAAATPTPMPVSTVVAGDDISFSPSPDGRWTAVVNADAGNLDLRGPDGVTATIFLAGSTVGAVTWSPDSHTLLVVQNNWIFKEPRGSGVTISEPIAIWQVDFREDKAQPARRIFQSNTLLAQTPKGSDNAEQILFGQWSPDSRYVLFWLGPLGASILADGLPLFALDVTTGKVSLVADGALLNPRYQSWAPDSSKLAVTVGTYRSVQVNKWLNLFDPTTGQSTTVISQTEQIPGIVTWSPRGDVVAYAAVSAGQTGPEWSDMGTFDNPAIAARRIYLLDPATGQYRRLNEVESYQDAPVWSEDGTVLYYIQRDGDKLRLMTADLVTGRAIAVPQAAIPLPEYVGFYGQSELDALLEYRPGGCPNRPSCP
jgi:dipeptidyl aminopeptidase/acylaminoacyl peptidase